MDRVRNIAWKTIGGTSLGGFAYEYEAVGRIVSRSYAHGDPSQSSQKTYSYDDLDRLASDGGIAYTYDAAGNRTAKTENGETITYSLGVGDRLASWTGGAYSYDVAGCVTRIDRDGRPTLDLTWNSQYQLVSVATNGVFAEGYAYDARSCVGWISGFGDVAKSGGKLYKGARKAGKDFKRLSKGEIKQFKKNVGDIHENKINSRQGLFKDEQGNIWSFPKNGEGPGSETGFTIDDLWR